MGFPFLYVGRDASASPATGLHHVHDREQAELVAAAIGVGAALPHVVSAHPARPLAALVKQGVRADHGRRPDHRSRAWASRSPRASSPAG